LEEILKEYLIGKFEEDPKKKTSSLEKLINRLLMVEKSLESL
jgi:hypothetical protein